MTTYISADDLRAEAEATARIGDYLPAPGDQTAEDREWVCAWCHQPTTSGGRCPCRPTTTPITRAPALPDSTPPAVADAVFTARADGHTVDVYQGLSGLLDVGIDVQHGLDNAADDHTAAGIALAWADLLQTTTVRLVDRTEHWPLDVRVAVAGTSGGTPVQLTVTLAWGGAEMARTYLTGQRSAEATTGLLRIIRDRLARPRHTSAA